MFRHVRLFATLWTTGCQASLSITKSQSLLKLMSVESVMPSNHLILRPPSPPALIFPSIEVFSNESVLHNGWPKYWSFNISPSNEYSGLISFRMDWLDLLAVQGTFKSLLQHHSSKASIRRCSAFFTVCGDPIDGSLSGSPIPGILQARTLEWVAISFSRVSSRPRD